MRAWAKGLLAAEAAVEFLIGHRSWLFRGDFLDIAVESGWEVFSGREMRRSTSGLRRARWMRACCRVLARGGCCGSPRASPRVFRSICGRL
jgi:hypothetical protein